MRVASVFLLSKLGVFCLFWRALWWFSWREGTHVQIARATKVCFRVVHGNLHIKFSGVDHALIGMNLINACFKVANLVCLYICMNVRIHCF